MPMKNERSLIVKILLWPFSVLYGIGVGIRNCLFNWGILPSESFDVPVVSVGNITVGGTGKTPFSEYLIRILKGNYKVGLLSRGYKRKSKGYRLLTKVSSPQEVGDEPFQIKRKFPDIMVAVDANRRRGIRNMLSEVSGRPDIIILDDAYQHRYVKPDVSILLIDYNRMITEDHLLPMGQLREPWVAKNRANIIVITKCPIDLKPIEFRLTRKLLKLYPYQSLFFTTLAYGNFEPLFPESIVCPLNQKVIKDYTALVVTGIASPKPFEEYLKPFVKEMLSINFSDHHNFTDGNLKRIQKEFEKIENKQKLILTTEKDAVRLMNDSRFPDELKKYIYYVPLYVKFLLEEGADFDEKLFTHLERNENFSKLVFNKRK